MHEWAVGLEGGPDLSTECGNYSYLILFEISHKTCWKNMGSSHGLGFVCSGSSGLLEVLLKQLTQVLCN